MHKNFRGSSLQRTLHNQLILILFRDIEAESDASTSVNGDQIAESAFQLFSKKNVPTGNSNTSETRGSTPAAEEQEREHLPSINDPSAIQDFFRKNRSRKLRDFVSVRRPHEIDGQAESSIPSDHPMRKILEHSDKDMSVKEALAKEFRNYKVRLPKKRIQFNVDPTIDPLDENSIVTPSTPSLTTVRDALTALVNVSDAGSASSADSTTPVVDRASGIKVATFTLIDLLLANGIAINDPKDCKELCRILTPSVFLIQHAIADHLLWNCGPNPLNPLATLSLEHYLISISRDLPPFACHKLQYFELGLNGWYGHNEVFDPCTVSPIVHLPTIHCLKFLSLRQSACLRPVFLFITCFRTQSKAFEKNSE
ncbi:hypothetical protein ANCCAN_23044 [Ancylostoma caninum]|uniref:Uncharacterized protein n=1 Tax=Ancylostoma caninum TaxID=29170 RepID=A0A368FG93_ANCCA|nr:hypothetical protein ANCCAN_23044 [Ancylostoma caninum]